MSDDVTHIIFLFKAQMLNGTMNTFWVRVTTSGLSHMTRCIFKQIYFPFLFSFGEKSVHMVCLMPLTEKQKNL